MYGYAERSGDIADRTASAAPARKPAPTAEAVLGLQRSAGNRATAMFVQRDEPEDQMPDARGNTVMGNYNAMGVGAYSPGLLHKDAGRLRLDAGLGEASAGFPVGGGLTGELGYQYGSKVFGGVGGKNWSARAGVDPGTGGFGAGFGYGAPLLPMPNLLRGRVNEGYAGIMNAPNAGAMIGPAAAAGGPLADTLTAGKSMPWGVGIQGGYDPEGLGAYGFAGIQGSF